MLSVLAVFGSPTKEWARVREHLADAQTISCELADAQANAVQLDPYESSTCLVDERIDELLERAALQGAQRREQLTRGVEARVHASRDDAWVRPLVERALSEDEAMRCWSQLTDLLRAASERDGVVVVLGD